MLPVVEERLNLAPVGDPEPTVELVNVTERYGKRRSAVTALDGVSTSFRRGTLTVRTVKITFFDPGAEGYAFTFG